MRVLLLLPALTLIAAAPAPDPTRLRASVDKLVSFGTRHTLSSATDPKRGIGAARRWTAAEFARIGRGCGGCITVDQPAKRMDGPRIPQGVDIVNVMGIQRGTGDPNHVVIVADRVRVFSEGTRASDDLVQTRACLR